MRQLQAPGSGVHSRVGHGEAEHGLVALVEVRENVIHGHDPGLCSSVASCGGCRLPWSMSRGLAAPGSTRMNATANTTVRLPGSFPSCWQLQLAVSHGTPHRTWQAHVPMCRSYAKPNALI